MDDRGHNFVKRNLIFAPKRDKAAEWQFHPNANLRKKFPHAELDFLGMDAQEGEFLSLQVLDRKKLKEIEVIHIAEGRVELINFSGDWQQVKSVSDDPDIVWDVQQMLLNWASDE